MDKFDIQKLRDLPIEGVADRLGLIVKKHKSLCPYHDDSHPSLSFSVSKNTFRCYVCGAHGGTIDLAMKVLNKPFIEACQWLANEHNVILTEWKPAEKKPRKTVAPDIPYLENLVRKPVIHSEASDFLFAERKIDPRVVRWLGISSIQLPTPMSGAPYERSFFNAPSLLIPYRDYNGNLLSVQARYLGRTCLEDNTAKRSLTGGNALGGDSKQKSCLEGSTSIPRFQFPRGSHCTIFNLPILRMLKPGEPLFITEGVTDCMAMLSAGHKAIAIPSATLLTQKDIKMLKEFAKGLAEKANPSTLTLNPTPLNLHMYPDADIPGEKLYFQLVGVANEIGACMVRHSLPHGFKDFGQWWAATH